MAIVGDAVWPLWGMQCGHCEGCSVKGHCEGCSVKGHCEGCSVKGHIVRDAV